MIELLAATALAPWTRPLAFGSLPGWSRGASGTVNSLYDNATRRVPAPKESAAWIATNVRYSDRATEDPPNRTLAHLPREAVIVWAVIFQAPGISRKPIRLDLGRAKRFACCEGEGVPGGRVRAGWARAGRSVLGHGAHLLRPAPDTTRVLRAQAQHAIDRLALPPSRR